MIVKLNWAEMTVASHVGMSRQLSAMQKNRPERYTRGKQEGVFDKHMIGAYGEMVISKLRNLFWAPTVGDIDKPDFIGHDGVSFQVRTTQMRSGELILHRPDEPNGRSDHPDQVFYGVRMKQWGENDINEFDVTGWLKAGDGQLQGYWRTIEDGAKHPAYFVPRAKLNPLDADECASYLERTKLHTKLVARDTLENV